MFGHQSEKPSTNLQRPHPTVAQRRVAWSRLPPSWPLHQAWINQYPKLFDAWGCLEHVFWKNPFATLSTKNRFAKLHKGFHLFPTTLAPILFFCVGTRIHRKTAGTGKKGAQKLASACWVTKENHWADIKTPACNSQGNRGIGCPVKLEALYFASFCFIDFTKSENS